MIFCGDLFCAIVERGCEIDQVVDGNAVAAIGGRLRRNWLSWRIRFAWDAANFDCLFRNWPDRFSGDAIEDVEESLFRWLRDGFNGFAVDRDIRKDRRGRNVHIPERMMHQLEMPFALAGFQVDADQRFAEEIVAGAMAAVKIAGWGFDRQIDKAELFVDGNLRPDAGVAGVFGGALFPGVVAKFAFLGDGVKNPEALAGTDVEAANVSFIVAHAAWRHAFAKCGADYDGVARGNGSRLNADFAGREVGENILVVVQL